jgi:phosphatidylinositol alpha-1,6-mannosyltransferase
VTICRIVKSKGIDIVLRALKILEEKGIRYRYIVAGSGSERPHLESLVNELGIKSKVQFCGYIDDERKWSYYRMADVFVMPSRVNPRLSHEGFGLTFIEAAAFGIPGVGTRAGGIPDAIVHGETGLLVAPESPEELAQALIFLYQNPEKRKEIGKAAMERARSQFSPTSIATHFQKEISRIM